MEESKPKNFKLIAIIAGAVVAVVAIIVILIVSLKGGAKGLVGKWLYERESLPYVYTFNADGTGSYGLTTEESPRTFTYKLTDEKVEQGVKQGKIEFLYENDTTPLILDYRIENGEKKLVVVDSFGNDVTYNRQ